MNVYDLIYVQLQLSPFRNEPVSQYSEHELSCGQTLCWIQTKTTLNTDFWNQNIPLTYADHIKHHHKNGKNLNLALPLNDKVHTNHNDKWNWNSKQRQHINTPVSWNCHFWQYCLLFIIHLYASRTQGACVLPACTACGLIALSRPPLDY